MRHIKMCQCQSCKYCKVLQHCIMFASVGHFAVAKFSFVPKKYESLPYSITALHDSCICGSGSFCRSKINSCATAKWFNVTTVSTVKCKVLHGSALKYWILKDTHVNASIALEPAFLVPNISVQVLHLLFSLDSCGPWHLIGFSTGSKGATLFGQLTFLSTSSFSYMHWVSNY